MLMGIILDSLFLVSLVAHSGHNMGFDVITQRQNTDELLVCLSVDDRKKVKEKRGSWNKKQDNKTCVFIVNIIIYYCFFLPLFFNNKIVINLITSCTIFPILLGI
ncbi:hypothetical protein Hanom_Chr09g00786221 [Helianthus anomalus]